MLNRSLGWNAQGITIEPDKRHAQIVIETLDLQHANEVSTPSIMNESRDDTVPPKGEKENKEEHESNGEDGDTQQGRDKGKQQNTTANNRMNSVLKWEIFEEGATQLRMDAGKHGPGK